MVHKLTSVILIGLLLQACSGNSSSTRTVSNEEEEVGVSGRVGAAIWGSRISATPINNEGGPVRIINDSGNAVFDGAAAQSEQSGNYEITIDKEVVGDSLVFIATNDNGVVGYRCEEPSGCGTLTYNTYVNIPGDLDIRAGVGEVAADMVINVNWVTDVASSMARTVYIDAVTNGLSADDRQDISQAVLDDVDTAKTGVYNEYTIELANLHVSELFGISDIIFVTPVGPSQMTTSTLSGGPLVEGLYFGSIVAALPHIAVEQSTDYMTLLTEITDDVLSRKGQLLQKSSISSDVTLHKILSTAAEILQANISYYNGQGARVPEEANTALDRLNAKASGLVVGQETNVEVDVPSTLASWGTNVEKAKDFIVDLTEAIKNFWAEDPEKSSFVDAEHARRMDAYYRAHENLYKQVVSDSLIGNDVQEGVLSELLAGAEVLIACQFGDGDCSPADSSYVIQADGNDDDDFNSNSVMINNTLELIMRPVGDEGDSGYTEFDFIIDTENNELTKGGTTYIWQPDVISDGSFSVQPYLRLFYEEEYTTPPSLDAVEPSQIAVIWPLVSFDQLISGAGSDSGEHTIRVLLEANLVAVKDPLIPSSEVRYNPLTVVFWVRSINSDENNISAMISQLRTTFPYSYYPETKWPGAAEFFKARSDAPALIDDMVVSLYQSQEVLSSGTVVDVFDKEIIGEEFISRIRLYPYDSTEGSTRSQACDVSIEGASRVVQQCSEPLDFAGEVLIDDLIKNNFDAGVLTSETIAANGNYTFDLTGTDIVNGDGEFVGLTPDTEYGPFDGTFESPIKMGIDRMTVSLSSILEDGDESSIPVAAEFSLQRRVDDLYTASLGYSYGEEDDYDFISDAIGIGVGGDAQAFLLEYAVTEEELANENDELSTIEVERGSWTIYRTGVVLGGDEQAVLSQIVTRTEYEQGSEEEGCGVNDRDQLSSAEGCEAVAYLTVRGALVGTIREERENVFVARFVDGTWMIIGD